MRQSCIARFGVQGLLDTCIVPGCTANLLQQHLFYHLSFNHIAAVASASSAGSQLTQNQAKAKTKLVLLHKAQPELCLAELD